MHGGQYGIDLTIDGRRGTERDPLRWAFRSQDVGDIALLWPRTPNLPGTVAPVADKLDQGRALAQRCLNLRNGHWFRSRTEVCARGAERRLQCLDARADVGDRREVDRALRPRRGIEPRGQFGAGLRELVELRAQRRRQVCS